MNKPNLDELMQLTRDLRYFKGLLRDVQNLINTHENALKSHRKDEAQLLEKTAKLEEKIKAFINA